MSEVPGFPPHVLAAADQDLAALDDAVNELIWAWREIRSEFPDRERAEIVNTFMQGLVALLSWPTVVGVAVVAVERLAREGL